MRFKTCLIGLLGCLVCILQGCGQTASQAAPSRSITERQGGIDPSGTTLATRIRVPQGFTRITADSASFAAFLRSLPLKPVGSQVRYYNGDFKPLGEVYEAVVDLPIGQKDLHQCADAVMRLRADYLFQQRKFDSIHFNFTNGFRADYAQWRLGHRITVKGNQVSWRRNQQGTTASANPPDTLTDYWNYLEMVFSYAGTASLEKEMKAVALAQMQIGDVFIQGGYPGHAVIVVDMAVDERTNNTLFLLAQSYMPAQEIQLLKNNQANALSPWYSMTDTSKTLITPEWVFKPTDLKRFSN